MITILNLIHVELPSLLLLLLLLESKLRQLPRGSVAVVVGHSNTVPQMVAELTGRAAFEIDEGQFDRLFVVTLFGRTGSVVELRY